MSDNPVAAIGNTIPTPTDPSVVRKTYTLVEFDAQQFYGYKVGEKATFSPAGHGDSFIMTVPLVDALAGTWPVGPNQYPKFCSTTSWDNLKQFPSIFVSGAWNSIATPVRG